MQVSIYLDSELVRKVDRTAKRTKKSRSEFIQSVLRALFFKKAEKTVFDRMCGTWDKEMADEMLRTIYENRRDSPRFA